MVKINISYPPYGSSQLIEVDDEKKWRVFLDKRLSDEVPADSLGDEFKGYVFKITGGYDKEGFSMMQGVMLNSRTRLLLDGRTGQYSPKRHGCRKRKSVRGCIIGIDMSCINVVIVKRGPADLPKLTDKASDKPSTKGPKRADNIRKAWGLGKKDDVRQYVVKKLKPGKEGKKDRIKSPKIQRLITPVVKQRRRRLLKLKRLQQERNRKAAADYLQILKLMRAQKRAALLTKRREAISTRTSAKMSEKKSTTGEKRSITLPKITTGEEATKKKVVKPGDKKAKTGEKKVVGKPKTATKGITKPKTVTKAKEQASKKAETAKAATTTAAQIKPEGTPKTKAAPKTTTKATKTTTAKPRTTEKKAATKPKTEAKGTTAKKQEKK